ncbi:MAG: hypothetical protein R2857_13200 [Vampirovibrionales bacterium]
MDFGYKLDALVNELQTVLGEFNAWKVDLRRPELQYQFNPGIFQNGGFKPMVDRLDMEVTTQGERRWLALYDPSLPPLNPYPIDPKDETGDGELMLPITQDILDEMHLLADEGLFLRRGDGEMTDFQKFIQSGINHRAIVLVEDKPALY